MTIAQQIYPYLAILGGKWPLLWAKMAVARVVAVVSKKK